MRKLLFLYTEIAGYFIACINTLVQEHEVQVRLVKWSVKAEAPFQFKLDKRIEVFEREEYTATGLEELCDAFNPDLVFITGWMDKAYVKMGKKFRRKNIPTVVGLDNPWVGTWRQRLGTAVFPLTLKSAYSHAWVAGIRQYEFARRLGFASSKIIGGYYSADVKAFQKKNVSPVDQYPKTILYVGRFLDWKGVQGLYDVFTKIQKENPNEWELLLVGNGPIQSELLPTDKIKIQSFLQPNELQKLAHQVGVFCLPSWHEHWGVVVHEFAAAGLPLIVSDGVNAGTAFVKHGYNGYHFEAKK